MTDDLVAKLRDEDSYYRLQEKHWCIDAEELERQRLAAADRIEALEAENERLREALGFAIRTLEEDMEEYNYRPDGPTLTILRAALGEKQ